MNYLGKPNALSIIMKSNILTLFLSSFVHKKQHLLTLGKNEICPYAKVFEKSFLCIINITYDIYYI